MAMANHNQAPPLPSNPAPTIIQSIEDIINILSLEINGHRSSKEQSSFNLTAMQQAVPASLRVMDDALAYHRTMLIHTAQKLKIPDFIGDETKNVMEIAKYTKTENVENVERLMYALVAIGYFTLSKEKVFTNNEMSSCLRRDHPLSVAGWIGLFTLLIYFCIYIKATDRIESIEFVSQYRS